MNAETRNQQNAIIMTAIYNELIDFNYGNNSLLRDAESLISSLCEQEYANVDSYVKDTVMIALQKYSEIVSIYAKYLKNWTWDRLPQLTQAILLQSYVHYYYIEKVDKKVVINIAVNLAKKYVDDKQAKFINAILDHGVLDESK